MDDKEAMYLENERLVGFYINKKVRYMPPNEREDIEQELKIALWKAAQNYDPERGSFSTWAIIFIQHAYLLYMRTRNRTKRKLNHTCVSLNQKIYVAEDEMELINSIESKQTSIESQVIWNMMLETLTEEDWKLIRLFSTVETQKEIGEILGGTQRMVSHRKDVLVNKMKRELA